MQDDLSDLRHNAPLVFRRRIPEYESEYARRGWKTLRGIDRVDVNERARAESGWQPRCDFRFTFVRLKSDADPRSAQARAFGVEGLPLRNLCRTA